MRDGAWLWPYSPQPGLQFWCAVCADTNSRPSRGTTGAGCNMLQLLELCISSAEWRNRFSRPLDIQEWSFVLEHGKGELKSELLWCGRDTTASAAFGRGFPLFLSLAIPKTGAAVWAGALQMTNPSSCLPPSCFHQSIFNGRWRIIYRQENFFK